MEKLTQEEIIMRVVSQSADPVPSWNLQKLVHRGVGWVTQPTAWHGRWQNRANYTRHTRRSLCTTHYPRKRIN